MRSNTRKVKRTLWQMLSVQDTPCFKLWKLKFGTLITFSNCIKMMMAYLKFFKNDSKDLEKGFS